MWNNLLGLKYRFTMLVLRGLKWEDCWEHETSLCYTVSVSQDWGGKGKRGGGWHFTSMSYISVCLVFFFSPPYGPSEISSLSFTHKRSQYVRTRVSKLVGNQTLQFFLLEMAWGLVIISERLTTFCLKFLFMVIQEFSEKQFSNFYLSSPKQSSSFSLILIPCYTPVCFLACLSVMHLSAP